MMHCRANYREWQTPNCEVKKPALTILQFSDTHLRNEADARWMSEQLQQAIAQYHPDILVHTGDITLDGRPSEWSAYTNAMNRLGTKNLVTWGNHDMALKNSAFAAAGKTRALDMGDYRLVLVDTAWNGPFVGSYTSIPESEFSAIAALADSSKKLLIFAHHPMGRGAPHFRLRNADAVMALFAHSQVLGVFTGHLHGAYLAPEGRLLYAGVAPLARHQVNHTWSQAKGYRIIQVEAGCLKTWPVSVPQ